MGRFAKEKKAISIDVEPFLSIMAIVLKLISLILVIIVMRIAQNPQLRKVIALFESNVSHGNIENPKSPSYIDCFPEGLVLYPGGTKVSWEALQRPDNQVENLLDKVQANRDNEYVLVMVRPGSAKLYRTVRNMLNKRPIDVGYEPIDADFKVRWDEARKALGVGEE